MMSRYELRHPTSTPTSIEASKDFTRIIAYGIEGKYDDPNACLSSVVQTYKNFTAGWQWAGHKKDRRQRHAVYLERESPNGYSF